MVALWSNAQPSDAIKKRKRLSHFIYWDLFMKLIGLTGGNFSSFNYFWLFFPSKENRGGFMFSPVSSQQQTCCGGFLNPLIRCQLEMCAWGKEGTDGEIRYFPWFERFVASFTLLATSSPALARGPQAVSLKVSVLQPEILFSFIIINIEIVLQWGWQGFVLIFLCVCMCPHLKIKTKETHFLGELCGDLICVTVLWWLGNCMLKVVLIVAFFFIGV